MDQESLSPVTDLYWLGSDTVGLVTDGASIL